MEMKTKLNPELAAQLVGEMKSKTEEQLYSLSGKTILPMWYAVCYQVPSLTVVDENTWGEFFDFVQLVIGCTNDGLIPEECLSRDEIGAAGQEGKDIEISDVLCDHCHEELFDDFESKEAYDSERKTITICPKCAEEDFERCVEPRCGVLHEAGMSSCPSCGCSRIGRKHR